MNMMPFVVIWACVAFAAIALALYRKLVTRHEDGYVHVADSEARIIPQQIAIADKLDVIDQWEKILIIITVVGGLLLAAAYTYQLWQESLKPLSGG